MATSAEIIEFPKDHRNCNHGLAAFDCPVETVSRVLTRLQEAGIVTVNRNLVAINDEAALRRTAGVGELPSVAGERC